MMKITRMAVFEAAKFGIALFPRTYVWREVTAH
jgi:hypothetical protein